MMHLLGVGVFILGSRVLPLFALLVMSRELFCERIHAVPRVDDMPPWPRRPDPRRHHRTDRVALRTRPGGDRGFHPEPLHGYTQAPTPLV
jgi:hypothetical protein